MMQLHLPMRQRPILQIWFWVFLVLIMFKEEHHQTSLPLGSGCIFLSFVLLKKEIIIIESMLMCSVQRKCILIDN